MVRLKPAPPMTCTVAPVAGALPKMVPVVACANTWPVTLLPATMATAKAVRRNAEARTHRSNFMTFMRCENSP